MAARGRQPGFRECYVYCVFDGVTPLYVGKGTGRRMRASAAKHGGEAKVLERFKDEGEAFKAERRWIAELMPQNNKCPGGNGGRAGPLPLVPPNLRSVVSEAEMRREMRKEAKIRKEMERVGSRVYAARFLLSRDLSACFPGSEVAGIRKSLEAVANGIRV